MVKSPKKQTIKGGATGAHHGETHALLFSQLLELFKDHPANEPSPRSCVQSFLTPTDLDECLSRGATSRAMSVLPCAGEVPTKRRSLTYQDFPSPVVFWILTSKRLFIDGAVFGSWSE